MVINNLFVLWMWHLLQQISWSILNISFLLIAFLQIIKSPIQQITWASINKYIFQHCWHSSHEQAFCEWRNEVLEWNNLSHKPALVQSPLLGFHFSSNKLSVTFKQKVCTNVRFFTVSAQPLPAVMMGLLLLGSFLEQLHSCPLVPYQPDISSFETFSPQVQSLVRRKHFLFI